MPLSDWGLNFSSPEQIRWVAFAALSTIRLVPCQQLSYSLLGNPLLTVNNGTLIFQLSYAKWSGLFQNTYIISAGDTSSGDILLYVWRRSVRLGVQGRCTCLCTQVQQERSWTVGTVLQYSTANILGFHLHLPAERLRTERLVLSPP